MSSLLSDYVHEAIRTRNQYVEKELYVTIPALLAPKDKEEFLRLHAELSERPEMFEVAQAMRRILTDNGVCILMRPYDRTADKIMFGTVIVTKDAKVVRTL